MQLTLNFHKIDSPEDNPTEEKVYMVILKLGKEDYEIGMAEYIDPGEWELLSDYIPWGEDDITVISWAEIPVIRRNTLIENLRKV